MDEEGSTGNSRAFRFFSVSTLIASRIPMAAVRSPLPHVAGFLFFSGACALIYQVAWFRELRLVFGASTAASSAVLAVFMAGLGIGSLVLGKRADRAKNAFALYANLELIVALTAALSPLLVLVAQKAYIGIGGASTLGSFGATVIRLLFTVIVLGPSTFAMGGTMPAAARAVERAQDVGRNSIAVLYGVNTTGAVFGTVAANFLLIEVFGTQMTLWLACLINALVAVLARVASRSMVNADAGDRDQAPATAAEPNSTARWFPPTAAASVGFAFMLVELVWYRMLSPLLGGSAYSFGLILAIALAGIGVGGALYSFGRRRGTLALFGATCALEALAIAVPFALGDRIAIFAVLETTLAHSSFGGAILAWTLITFLVVFPAAVVSGYQFPAIIALYGTGAKDVGSDVGRAYIANTVGSLLGALAGGFGLLPLLSAPTCWRLVVCLLVATTFLAIGLEMKTTVRDRWPRVVLGGCAAVVAVLCLLARGPTAVWRHSGIGANRAMTNSFTAADIASFEGRWEATILWEAEGLESSVAINNGSGDSFIVNGKSDGHVIGDRATQVMSGLLAALVHGGDPKSALVVGLGTGGTAGWLATAPSIERVDVMELEPAILRVAETCKAANENVLANPKVHITLGDAREGLLTSRAHYDIVFSEPSNPYRAGISSLYTVEYYRAVAERLNEGGVFVQWIQAYDIDAFTIATAITTVHEVFPSVSLWQPESGDLLLIGERALRPLDLDRMRTRLAEDAYRTAAMVSYGTASLEGLLSHYVANPAFADAVTNAQLGTVNHDDQNFLEFAFARGVGSREDISSQVTALSRRLGHARPVVNGTYDEQKVIAERLFEQASTNHTIDPFVAPPTPEIATLMQAVQSFASDQPGPGLAQWTKLGREPQAMFEAILVARAMAQLGDARLPATLPLVARVNERTLLEALWLIKTGRTEKGLDLLSKGFIGARTDPWIAAVLLQDAIDTAVAIGKSNTSSARRLLPILGERFAADAMNFTRIAAYLELSLLTGDPKDCVVAFDRAGRLPFDNAFVQGRAACYESAKDPRLPAARAELGRLQSFHPTFGESILSPAERR